MGMKQYINRIRRIMSVFTALLMFGLISMRAYAESGDGFLLDEAGNLTLVSEHAAKEGISSLQFSLSVNAPDGADVSFVFSSSSADVCEYRYDESSKVLNVYIAGKKALFESDVETLAVGVVKVTGSDDKPVAVSVVPDSLKYVYGTEAKTMEGVSLPGEVMLSNAKPAETSRPAAETTPPANNHGTSGGQNSTSGGASHGTGSTQPPAGSSSGSTAGGNYGNGSTPEPVSTYSPQRTPDPKRESDESASDEPGVTGTSKPEKDDTTPAVNDSGGRDTEKEKKADYFLPIVMGVTAVLFIAGLSLVAVALRRNKNEEESL